MQRYDNMTIKDNYNNQKISAIYIRWCNLITKEKSIQIELLNQIVYNLKYKGRNIIIPAGLLWLGCKINFCRYRINFTLPPETITYSNWILKDLFKNRFRKFLDSSIQTQAHTID
ncbi:unnamed protein product [Blepharisma stoltei]|uniref:Uncharacterized protein n=1 Tax=Blepharisma stoltei TaxID=1481888 RepID=A0AAU9INN6_9CILI|nr:unnamed protein product [Blepharisma stoltei]